MYTHVSDIRHRRLMKRDIAVDDKKKRVNEEICLNMQMMITAAEIECNGIIACHFHTHSHTYCIDFHYKTPVRMEVFISWLKFYL